MIWLHHHSMKPLVVFLLLLTHAWLMLHQASSALIFQKDPVRLANPVEITVDGVGIDDAGILPDNETLVVVGGKLKPPGDMAWVYDKAPPAGAIVKLKTKEIQGFTNGHEIIRIKSVALSPDGFKIFTACSNEDPFVRVWDVTAQKKLSALVLEQKSKIQVFLNRICAFSSGKKIAVGQNGSICLLDPLGSDQSVFLKSKDLIYTPDSLAISLNDTYLACSTWDYNVVIWDVASKQAILTTNMAFNPLFNSPKGKPTDLQIGQLGFTKSGKHLLVCWEEIIRTPKGRVPGDGRGIFLIDITKRKMQPLLTGRQNQAVSFALHPSEKWLVTLGQKGGEADPSTVNEMRIYRYPSLTSHSTVEINQRNNSGKILFTPDGKKLVVVDTGGVENSAKIRVWDFLADHD